MDNPFFRNDAVILDRELHFFRGPLNNFLLSLYIFLVFQWITWFELVLIKNEHCQPKEKMLNGMIWYLFWRFWAKVKNSRPINLHPDI